MRREHLQYKVVSWHGIYGLAMSSKVEYPRQQYERHARYGLSRPRRKMNALRLLAEWQVLNRCLGFADLSNPSFLFPTQWCVG